MQLKAIYYYLSPSAFIIVGLTSTDLDNSHIQYSVLAINFILDEQVFKSSKSEP